MHLLGPLLDLIGNLSGPQMTSRLLMQLFSVCVTSTSLLSFHLFRDGVEQKSKLEVR